MEEQVLKGMVNFQHLLWRMEVGSSCDGVGGC